MSDDIRTELVTVAKEIGDPIAVLQWFMQRVGPDFDVGNFVFTFGPTFGIPIRTLHEVATWHGFNDGGDASDDDIRRILAPYLQGA